MFYDYVDIISREIWKKKIWFRTSMFFIFTTLLFMFLWFTSPPPKTYEDLVRQYIQTRLNWTPYEIEKAFSSPLEYRIFGDVFREQYIEWARKNNIYSCFVLESVTRLPQRTEWEVRGIRILFTDKGIVKEAREKYLVKLVGDKFLLSETGVSR